MNSPETDPAYVFNLKELLEISPPPEPEDFAAFWLTRYQRVMKVNPAPRLQPLDNLHPDFECYGLSYSSTDGFEIGGWCLIPKHVPVVRGVVVGHGYGGREAPDFDLPIADAVSLFPCFRGLSRSKCRDISDNPSIHVLHNIDNPEQYILGGCVDDLWLAVSVLLQLFPSVTGHVSYMGASFGGGIGAMALPWDQRIQRAHFNVPSFGNQPLRLQLPTWGSAAAVQKYQHEHGDVLPTLSYYDAAASAKHIQVPVQVAAALSDPMVTPPGQFSIFNALPQQKRLFVLDKGHSDYPRQAEQEQALFSELKEFFTLT